MKPIQRLLGVGLLLLAASSAPAQADSASQSPDALRVLKSMSDFIDSQAKTICSFLFKGSLIRSIHHKICDITQRIDRARVQPGKPATQISHL